MKEVFIIAWFLSICIETKAQSQSISLAQCYQLAEQHYPLAKQKDLISQTKAYSIENAQKGYLPQLNILGQATYQSDVTGIPISFPGIDIPKLSKDQYKIYGEINQTLYDGGMIRNQKQLYEANSALEEQNVAVELYKLRERINQLYFGILLINKQLQLIEFRKSDIQSGLDRTNGAIANGIAFKTNADVLKAELLLADQMTIEQKALQKGYLNMLGLFIGQVINEDTVLEEPPVLNQTETAVTRPEIAGFDYRKRILDINEQMLMARNQPKISLFVQGGYGKPGLNFLKNEFVLYGIGGVRFSWFLTGFYTNKTDKLIIENNRRSVEIQKESFLFNTHISNTQEQSEIGKLRELIGTDDAIIALRTNIKNTSNAQLENGVKMPADYVRDVNAENQARQNLAVHQVQLLYAQYRLKTIQGE